MRTCLFSFAATTRYPLRVSLSMQANQSEPSPRGSDFKDGRIVVSTRGADRRRVLHRSSSRKVVDPAHVSQIDRAETTSLGTQTLHLARDTPSHKALSLAGPSMPGIWYLEDGGDIVQECP